MSPTERDLLSKLYANSQETVLILGADQKILLANPRAEEDTSYPVDELLGKAFVDLFLPEETQAIVTLLEATLQWQSGTDPRRTLRRKSGKKIVVEISTMATDFEGAPAIACSLRDITDRVKDEEKIRQYSQELEKINAELEARVQARTRELSDQKKELQDVMNNIQEAILTVGPDLLINPGISLFAQEVFGQSELVGLKLPELLYSKAEERDNLAIWLKQVFEQPEMWEVIRDFGPSSLHFVKSGSSEAENVRDLRCEWRPILEDSKILKMMFVCQDVTEQKKLEAEISRREAEHREELELIAQLIDVSAELMDQFVRDFEGTLKSGRQILESEQAGEKSGIERLLRELHTFKGAARQVGLRTLTARAHHLEALAQGPMPDLSTLRTEFDDLAQGTQKILDIYRKVTQGGSASPGAGHLKIEAHRLDALAQRLGPPLRHGEDVRKTLLWLLEAPSHGLLENLKSIAEATATELGRKVEVHLSGGEERIDQRILHLLTGALSHAVRNAVDHGGEPPEARTAASKPEALQIVIHLERTPEDLLRITLSDDGAGVAVEKVRARAIEKKLVDPDRAKLAKDTEVLNYLFLAGLSTRAEVSEISGRGIGLDALDEVVRRQLHGEAKITSRLGQGTTVTVEFRDDALAPRPSASEIECLSVPPLVKIEGFLVRPNLVHWIDPETPSADFIKLRVTRASDFAQVPGLEFYLDPATKIHSAKFTDYSQKAATLQNLLQTISGKGQEFQSFEQVIGDIAEEMLMNAFFDAPRDAEGRPKYASLARGQKHILEPWEAPTLRWASDQRFVAISIEDPFGALTRSTFFRYLDKGYRQGRDQIDRKPGGAGLGLYTLMGLSHWVGVSIEPGRRTEMTCIVEHGRSFEQYQRGAKSISFWEKSAQARA